MNPVFLSRETKLTTEVKERLKSEFHLTDDDIHEIEWWHSEDCLFAGTVLVPHGRFNCAPYDTFELFLRNFPDGEKWKEE